jgi:hypothetical protein
MVSATPCKVAVIAGTLLLSSEQGRRVHLVPIARQHQLRAVNCPAINEIKKNYDPVYPLQHRPLCTRVAFTEISVCGM